MEIFNAYADTLAALGGLGLFILLWALATMAAMRARELSLEEELWEWEEANWGKEED